LLIVRQGVPHADGGFPGADGIVHCLHVTARIRVTPHFQDDTGWAQP